MDHVGFAPRVQEPRPPYIRFDKRAVEKRDFAGNVTYEDKDFIFITPQGSKDTVEKVVDEYFVSIKKQMQDGQFPVSWYEAYTKTYQAWKTDQEPPVFGTSIRNWPAASPAEIKILTALGVIAVEDLAQANEEMMAKIGMGARSLKQRAADFLEAKNGTAPLVQRLDAATRTLERMEARQKQQDEEIRILRIQAQQGQQASAQLERAGVELAPVEDRLAAAREAAEASGPTDAELVADAIDGELI